ncbi:hypothetical protein PACTADRAFT_34358 [Pachysolen tannophilus NRRL Y-2460]|uniref:Myb-like domain-containing protein n=1 Tax=Pachysolen tannophilus NRRL Y-2460 TaxID=669874 RepID=A0A1E4TS87_PACTA|nr:hypothetical protein PACTADRAFT_34358 [Pachysolen tannophilus NRRL Y-2460]
MIQDSDQEDRKLKKIKLDDSRIANDNCSFEAERQSRRSFKGNKNYVTFYNKEVKEFSILNDANFTCSDYDSRLKGSYINVSGDGAILSSEGNQDDNFSGTYWSSKEKDIFFKCLGRYSIHNIDLIQEFLPGKSHVELINYYELLKQDLKLLKRRRKTFKRLVQISDFPIAYEMSESFIRMEEEQSSMITAVEKIRDSDYIQKNKIEQDEDSLLNYENSKELIEKFYSVNNVIPITSNRLIPKLSKSSAEFLQDILINLTKELLANIVQFKIQNIAMYRSSLNHLTYKPKIDPKTGELKLPLSVNQTDIYRAVDKLNLKRPSKISDYFKQLPKRLDLIIVTEKENLVNNDKLAKKSKSLKNNKNFDPEDFVFKFQESDNDNDDNDDNDDDYNNNNNNNNNNKVSDGTQNVILEKEEETNIQRSKPVHISSLKRPRNQILKDDVDIVANGKYPCTSNFFVNEEESLLENQLALKLFELESSTLNKIDTMESRNYEHVLLTYLSTFEKPTLLEDEAKINEYIQLENEISNHKIQNLEKDFYEISDQEDTEIDHTSNNHDDDDNNNNHEDDIDNTLYEITPEMLTMYMYEFAAYD